MKRSRYSKSQIISILKEAEIVQEALEKSGKAILL